MKDNKEIHQVNGWNVLLAVKPREVDNGGNWKWQKKTMEKRPITKHCTWNIRFNNTIHIKTRMLTRLHRVCNQFPHQFVDKPHFVFFETFALWLNGIRKEIKVAYNELIQFKCLVRRLKLLIDIMWISLQLPMIWHLF